MDMGSFEDLINYQEGREEIPCCQVGKAEKMRLSNSFMNLEASLGQREELTGRDQRIILIIGRIEVFLPHILVEARSCVAEVVAGEGQLVVTFIEENMEQTLMFSLAKEEENSVELLEIFSQDAEQEVTGVLEVVEIEEEHAVNMLTPWDKDLKMLEDWLNHIEPVNDCHYQTIIHIL
jgi:hypothetical protein